MSKKPDGGLVFPHAVVYELAGYEQQHNGALTVRDYFAAAALTARFIGVHDNDIMYADTAAACYEIADAMLKARAK